MRRALWARVLGVSALVRGDAAVDHRHVVEPADSENHRSIVCRFDGASSKGQVICSLRGRSMSVFSPLGADLGRRLPIRGAMEPRRITLGPVRASNTVFARASKVRSICTA